MYRHLTGLFALLCFFFTPVYWLFYTGLRKTTAFQAMTAVFSVYLVAIEVAAGIFIDVFLNVNFPMYDA